MNSTRHLSLRLLPVVALLLAFLSCDRRPLELYYDHVADVRLTFDWQSRFGERPQGMTIMIADLESDKLLYYDVTNNVDETTLRLSPGTYKLTAFNRTFEEYGSIGFFNRDNYTDIYALCKPMQSQQARSAIDGTLCYEPEAIGVAIDTFTVLPGDNNIVFTDYDKPLDGETIVETVPQTVLPMTTQLKIYVHVIGYPYVSALKGTITGMADGFRLSQLWRTDGEATHELNDWHITKENDSTAWLSTTVSTFGLPHGRELLSQRDSTHNVVSLQFTLANASTYERQFNVGKLIRYVEDHSDDGQGNGSLELSQFGRLDVTLRLELRVDVDIEIPHENMTPATGAGFDADVDPWIQGETGTIIF